MPSVEYSAASMVKPARSALSAGGATGYLLKERITDGEALVAAVRTVVSGATVVDPAVVSLLLGSTGRPRLLDALTARSERCFS